MINCMTEGVLSDCWLSVELSNCNAISLGKWCDQPHHCSHSLTRSQARHRTLSWGSSQQSAYSLHTSLRPISLLPSHSRVGLTRDTFLPGFISTRYTPHFPDANSICQQPHPLRCGNSKTIMQRLQNMMRTVHFWAITQRVVVVPYRRFGTTHWSHIQGSRILRIIRPMGCPETSVRNYQYSPRNSPVECSSHLLHGGSLKSYKTRCYQYNHYCLQSISLPSKIQIFSPDTFVL